MPKCQDILSKIMDSYNQKPYSTINIYLLKTLRQNCETLPLVQYNYIFKMRQKKEKKEVHWSPCIHSQTKEKAVFWFSLGILPSLREVLRSVLLQHEQGYLFIAPPVSSQVLYPSGFCRETESICILTNLFSALA